jgi:hypothetical protein
VIISDLQYIESATRTEIQGGKWKPKPKYRTKTVKIEENQLQIHLGLRR